MDQLALISAVLGGFGFTFLATLITVKDESKHSRILFIGSLLAALIFFICTLGWSLMSLRNQGNSKILQIEYAGKHKLLSLLFIFGILCLATTMAVSGWLRSKTLGIWSTVICIFGLCIIFYLISAFIR